MKKLLVEIELGFDENCTLEDVEHTKSGFRSDLKECISETNNECDSLISFKISETILDSKGDSIDS